jgi:hypothetical protein
MKFAEAKTAFIKELKQKSFATNATDDHKALFATIDVSLATVEEANPDALSAALQLLEDYFADLALDEITAANLQEVLSRRYLEEAVLHLPFENPPTDFPTPEILIHSLKKFFLWSERKSLNSCKPENAGEAFTQQQESLAQECLKVLQNLQKTLPRAIEISQALTKLFANRGGAIAFPEFLTSFEEGGHNHYDIGNTANEITAIEGYFRILKVEGTNIEAVELITDEPVWPIIFPQKIAQLIQADYIINLELIRRENVWQIVNCGFAYPPGTEV